MVVTTPEGADDRQPKVRVVQKYAWRGAGSAVQPALSYPPAKALDRAATTPLRLLAVADVTIELSCILVDHCAGA